MSRLFAIEGDVFMFICSQTIGRRKKKRVHVAGFYGHILSARACSTSRLWLNLYPLRVAMDVRVTEPSTPGGRCQKGVRAGRLSVVTLADERARQRGTQTSTFSGAPVLDCLLRFTGGSRKGSTHAI
jgi:hypothetical protein